MRKLDPNATNEVWLDDDKDKPRSERPTFVYRVLSCREYMEKVQLADPDSSGQVSLESLANAAAFGLVRIDNAEVETTAKGLLESLSVAELLELSRKSRDECALSTGEKKTSDSPASVTSERSANDAGAASA